MSNVFSTKNLKHICHDKTHLTKRAPDAGESGAIPSIFLRLILFPVGRRPAARPSAGNANRWQADAEEQIQNRL